jgi:RND family efflux transporter MFP subunit
MKKILEESIQLIKSKNFVGFKKLVISNDFLRFKRFVRTNVKTKRGLFIIAAFIAVLLVATFYFSRCGDGPEEAVITEVRSKKKRPVKVSIINTSGPGGTIEYVGLITAHRKVKVASELGGTIEKIYFEKGNQVIKGEPLAEIGTTGLHLEAQMAAAAYSEAKAAQFEAENNFARARRLYEIGAISESNFDSAKSSVEIARANREKAKTALAISEDRLRKSRIHAPCDGVISLRDVEEGEVIPPGTIITQVVDLDQLKIKMSMSEKDIKILEKHQRFPFSIDAIPGETFYCSLFFISPTADPQMRSFPLELMLENKDTRMADGMTARVKFPIAEEKKTIKIPTAWLSEENGKIGLFVINDGKAVFRNVSLGSYYDQRVEILSGVTDQELVITNPAGVKSGDPVDY